MKTDERSGSKLGRDTNNLSVLPAPQMSLQRRARFVNQEPSLFG
jgi:hypothetical protein